MWGASRWVLALFASVLAHLAAAGLFVMNNDPQPPPTQSTAHSTLDMDTVYAPREQAPAQQPKSDDAAEAEAQSANLAAGAVAQSKAATLPLPTSAAPVVPQKLTSTKAGVPQAPTLSAVPQSLTSTKANVPKTPVVTAQTSHSQTISAQPSAPDSIPVTAVSAPLAPALQSQSSNGAELQAAQPTAFAALAQQPKSTQAPQAALPQTHAKASLAWQFGDRQVTDPKAIATIQAFVAPDTLQGADDVRDDLASMLAGVDCARISATFLPETGQLELRGHIPDPALTEPILKALQAQMGDGIPITVNLQHLPAPQCNALSGIAAAGLPQSTDQFTNALLIGETSHARSYDYVEGQLLQFDLTAPDYDAFIYVDYFNADGEVIHLIPNDTIALQSHTAETLIGVGHDRPGEPGLRVTIGPPFGQEIAVAFAASRPLYDGLRPIVEPAAPYLALLTEKVAEARANDPDFKGEWVYFFITTSPATQ